MREVLIAECTGCNMKWEMDYMPDACECEVSDNMPMINLYTELVED